MWEVESGVRWVSWRNTTSGRFCFKNSNNRTTLGERDEKEASPLAFQVRTLIEIGKGRGEVKRFEGGSIGGEVEKKG